MRKAKGMKIIIYLVLAIVLIALGAVSYISYALPNVGASPDMNIRITADKVERGKYLAWHVMMCADCHSIRDFSYFAGPPTPGTEFAGGDIFDHTLGFPGRFIASNITPAGIGDWTDGELYRLITTGVKRDGEPIFPVMPYQNYGKMAPEDIKSVIAYLRTLPAVETNHPKSKADFPFNLILRTIPEKAAPTQKPHESDRIAYGEYLFISAACGDCHTQFEKGSFTGPVGGGGREFSPPDGSVIRSANITPHETGIAHYTRDLFIERFKTYTDTDFNLPKVKPGQFQTIMPWTMYAGMKEEDIGAIYDFLITLEPFENHVIPFSPSE